MAEFSEELEERALCRVCHESHGVLYHPCRCDGSIRYVHQDCLITWLKISRQTHEQAKCELCGSRFMFRSVYKTGGSDPPRLSLVEFFSGLIPRIVSFLKELTRVSITTFFWLFCLPILVTWFVELSTSFVLVGHMQGVYLFRPIGQLASCWWNGLLLTLFIAFSTVSMIQFAVALQQEFLRVNQIMQANQVQIRLGRNNRNDRVGGRDRAVQMDAEVPPNILLPEALEERAEIAEENLNVESAAENATLREQIPHRDPDPELEPEVEVEPGPEPQAEPDQPQAGLDPPPIIRFPPPVDVLAPMLGAGGDHQGVALPRIALPGGMPLELTLNLWCAVVLFLLAFVSIFHLAPVIVGRSSLVMFRLDSRVMSLQPVFTSWVSGQLLLHRRRAEELHVHYFGVPLPALDLTPDFLWPRVVVIIESCVGYVVICCMGFIFATAFIVVYHRHTMSRVLEVVEAQSRALWVTARSWLAVSSFLLYDGGVLPQMLGWLIGISTLRVFETTLSHRIELCSSVPVICTIAHWIVGFFFMLHLNVVVSELRGMLRADVLAEVLHTREIDDQALDQLAQLPPLALLRRALINTCVSIPGVIFTVLIPTVCGHWVSPCSHPLRLRFNEVMFDVQLPMEMLVFHIMVPVALERVRHREMVRLCIEGFLRRACALLALEDEVLEPVLRARWGEEEHDQMQEQNQALFRFQEQEQEDQGRAQGEVAEVQQVQPRAINDVGMVGEVVNQVADRELMQERENVQFIREVAHVQSGVVSSNGCIDTLSTRSWYVKYDLDVKHLPLNVRIALLCFSGMLSIAVLSSWLLHVPLVVGKALLTALHLSVQHDLYSLSAGFCVCWLGAASVRFVARDAVLLDTEGLLRSALKWAWIATKLFLLSAVWLTIPPLLTGMLLEAIVIVPLRTPLNETPRYPFVQCWAVGLVLLKIWTRCLLVGALGDNRYRPGMERIIAAGAANVDLIAAMRTVVLPVILMLLDLLATPYFIARLAGAALTTCYGTQTLIVRYSFVSYFCLYVSAYAFGAVHEQLRRVYNEIRDSRYLVGTELTNVANAAGSNSIGGGFGVGSVDDSKKIGTLPLGQGTMREVQQEDVANAT